MLYKDREKLRRERVAFQSHLALIIKTRDWKPLAVGSHEHIQLTSEPED